MSDGCFRGAIHAIPATQSISTEGTSQNSITFSSVKEVDLDLDTSRFHIALPLEGKEPYIVDDQYFEADTGQYFLFNPHQKARCFGRFQQVVKGVCLFISPESLYETAQSMEVGLERSMEMPEVSGLTMKEFPVKTFSLLENDFGNYLQRLKPKLLALKEGNLILSDKEAFFSELAEAFLKGHKQVRTQYSRVPASKLSTKEELYKRLAAVYAFIEASPTEKIQIKDLVAVACISKYHLIRCYKEVYGLTPYQHLLAGRLEAAKPLLKENLTHEEIAFRLHFTDGKAFVKAFKKRFGYPPGQYSSFSK